MRLRLWRREEAAEAVPVVAVAARLRASSSSSLSSILTSILLGCLLSISPVLTVEGAGAGEISGTKIGEEDAASVYYLLNFFFEFHKKEKLFFTFSFKKLG